MPRPSTFVQNSATVANLFPQSFQGNGRRRGVTRKSFDCPPPKSCPLTLLPCRLCFSDNSGGTRALSADSYVDTANMTIESCIGFCDAKKYIFAGLEYSVRSPSLSFFLRCLTPALGTFQQECCASSSFCIHGRFRRLTFIPIPRLR